jgi:hypothetical protein
MNLNRLPRRLGLEPGRTQAGYLGSTSGVSRHFLARPAWTHPPPHNIDTKQLKAYSLFVKFVRPRVTMESFSWELETDFELDTQSGQLLKIENKGIVNREKIVQAEIHNTRFKATLVSVTYGTYDGLPACLLLIDYSFFFRIATLSRFIFAKVHAKLSQVTDANFTRPDSYDCTQDPVMKLYAPKEVWGQSKIVQQKRTWALTVPVVTNTFGVEAGVTVNGGVEKNVDRDHRMNILGDTLSDDDHVNGDNEVEWNISENKAQKDGIPHGLKTAIIASLPSNGNGIQLDLKITPSVAFSINPLRLIQKKHDPLYLDGKTAKGKSPLPATITDMNDPSIDWATIIELKEEHQVRRSLLTFLRHCALLR